MPVLGADMDEGTLLEWLVKPGDQVRRGDAIAVVDTAKSAIEVESFHTGTIDRLVVGIGETVPVGTVLATIVEPGGEGARAAAQPEAQPARKRPPRKSAARTRQRRQPVAAGEALPGTASPPVRHLARQLGVDLAALTGTGPGGAVTRADVQREAAARAPATKPVIRPPQPAAGTVAARQPVTPLARRVAAELSIDVAALTGSGPDGAVREADVRRALSAARQLPQQAVAEEAAVTPAAADGPPTRPAAPQPATRAPAGERVQAMRQAIGRLMARSKREIPHYYLSNTVDMACAMDWLHQRNRELEVTERLVPAALLLKAAALAARQIPQLNGYWEDDHFTPGAAVHLGVAISLRGGGLVTPAIHAAADLRPAELMTQLRDLVTRARGGRLRRAELTDATITVTNLGDQGVETVFGVIYPPQVALVGIGKIIERPVAVGGLIGARPVVITTLSADHRASDGYTGARYLAALSELLQRPEEL